MSKITRLPGDACRFNRQGKCLFEERLNPGYNTRWRCAVITGWESDYDDFLLRADSFGLDEGQAATLWDKRFRKMLGSHNFCKRSGRPSPEVTQCPHLHGDVCLIAVPACGGVCARFRHKDERKAQ